MPLKDVHDEMFAAGLVGGRYCNRIYAGAKHPWKEGAGMEYL